MSRRFQLGTHAYGLVRAWDILLPPDDVVVARHRLARMEGLDEYTVRRVLDDNGLLPLSFRAGDDLLDLLARAWVQRLITVIEHREPARLLDGPEVRDLVPPRALGELPAGPAPVPEPGETTPTWVSFEVVDDQGNRADGAFRCQLDARLEGGELEQVSHRFEPLKRGASAQVYLEMLRWPVTDPVTIEVGLDDVNDVDDTSDVHDDDVTPPPAAGNDADATTFEVVDEDGRALAGTARWSDDGGALLEVEFGGRVEVAASKPRLELRISVAGSS